MVSHKLWIRESNKYTFKILFTLCVIRFLFIFYHLPNNEYIRLCVNLFITEQGLQHLFCAQEMVVKKSQVVFSN